MLLYTAIIIINYQEIFAVEINDFTIITSDWFERSFLRNSNLIKYSRFNIVWYQTSNHFIRKWSSAADSQTCYVSHSFAPKKERKWKFFIKLNSPICVYTTHWNGKCENQTARVTVAVFVIVIIAFIPYKVCVQSIR